MMKSYGFDICYLDWLDAPLILRCLELHFYTKFALGVPQTSEICREWGAENVAILVGGQHISCSALFVLTVLKPANDDEKYFADR